MPVLRKKSPNLKDRAERILKVADPLFCERGFDGVSMSDVAREAGVNKALIFYYYQNKAGLFEAVLEGYYRAHTRSLEKALQGSGSLRERLHRLIDAYFDFIEENQRFPMLVQQEVGRRGEHLGLIRENLAALYRSTERLLREALPKKGPLSPKHFFVSFSGITINFFTYAPVLGSLWGSDPTSPRARAERRAHVHWVVDSLIDGLARDPGAIKV